MPSVVSKVCIVGEGLGLVMGMEMLPRALSLEMARREGFSYALQFRNDALELVCLNLPRLGSLRVDFACAAMKYRLERGRIGRSLLARAIGIKPGKELVVMDATTGLGRDAFILAALGCRVLCFERAAVMRMLLADGLRRAGTDPNLAEICGRMVLKEGDSICALAKGQAESPDVIYLDPMFPDIRRKALCKKEMRFCREIAGDDADADRLLAVALESGCRRVAVKRMRHDPPLGNKPPTHSISGKSNRFDVYLR